MTYRTMHGLGATPSLTQDQIAMLLKAVNNTGGCTAQMRTAMTNLPCLNMQLVQWFGACLGGVKPPSMTQAEYDGACASLASCGAFNKLGCPQDGAELMAQMSASLPACLTEAMAKEFTPIVDYCRATPMFNGANKPMNAACWSMSRFPDLYAKIMNVPLCAPPPSAAPPTPPPVTVAPPVTATPSADQPTSVPTASMVPDEPTDTGPDLSTTSEAGMSTTTMAMYGIGAVAVLGLGYWLLKKK